MSLVFNYSADPLSKKFLSTHGLNSSGVAAAIASNAVSLSDADLEAKVNKLKTESSEFRESFENSACDESESRTLRACVAKKIYSSLLSDFGTGRRPTHAWKKTTLMRALNAFKIISAPTLRGINTNEQLLAELTKNFSADAVSSARAMDAYRCMLAVKNQIANGHFGQWGDDPQ